MKPRIYQVCLAVMAALAVSCTFEVPGEGTKWIRIQHSFFGHLPAVILALVGVYLAFGYLLRKEVKADVGSILLSGLLSVSYVVSMSYYHYNSELFFLGSKYQCMVTMLCVIGYGILLYALIQTLWIFLVNLPERGIKESCANKVTAFIRRHLFGIGFWVILLAWLPFNLLNYPGSGCPDSLFQLQQAVGLEDWTVHHPPLSTAIMGGLFLLGRQLVDANFGFFLYSLFQMIVGALICSYSMKKLQRMGCNLTICIAGLIFFAFTPLFGLHAQWVEKDFLYSLAVLLQLLFLFHVVQKRDLDRKDLLELLGSSLLVVSLRNNGIYAILPALIVLIFVVKKEARKKALILCTTTFLLFAVGYKILFPSLGMGGGSISEMLSIPFQQTARYVCEHPEDVTDEEQALFDEIFFGYDRLSGYDPVISDPIKNYYNGKRLGEYLQIWFRMFWRHPGCYVSAFINISFGYLAPVIPDTEAWIQLRYPDGLTELGVHHVFDSATVAGGIIKWRVLSLNTPGLRLFAMAGLYTWIYAVITFFLWKAGKRKELVVLIPGWMNILVCLASPLAAAIRYELPTLVTVPFLIGATVLLIRDRSGNYKQH